MSVLKRVPSNIRDLRLFIQTQDKYYYLAVDAYVSEQEDEEGVHEVEVPRELKELGYFSMVWVIPTNGAPIPMYKFKKNKETGFTRENGSNLQDYTLNTQGFAERLVYTDYPPAAGSVPLTYDDYLEFMRVNDLGGGRKKTRNLKNIKLKKTRKHRGKRRNR